MTRCIECLKQIEKPVNTEQIEWRSGETSEVPVHEDCVPKRTRLKMFVKEHYQRLEEKKYEEPTERAKEVIEEAGEDDILQLEIRAEGTPKVLEASRIQDRDDMFDAMKAGEPFDSEVGKQ